MRAADIPGEFSLSNRAVQADPRWWGGEPIWNTAEKQGRKAGAMFWPGSETVIGGRQATYWTPFDDDMPNGDRVKRVLGWLKLPESERPSFLTLYFSDVDSAGHSCGPDSDEVKKRGPAGGQGDRRSRQRREGRGACRSRALRRRQRSRHGGASAPIA